MYDKITIETTNQLAEKYHKRYNDNKIMEKHRKVFISLLKGKHILDIGCGTGRDCREFSKLGMITSGIDISDEMLKIAKKESPKTFLYKLDMEEITFKSKFNGLWICSSLYHIKKKDIFPILNSFNKALKRNGIIFITVKEGIGQGYHKRKYFGNLEKFYAFYEDYEIIRLLSGSGFNVISMNKEFKDQIWINIYAKKKR